MIHQAKIGVVVLTHNSAADLDACLNGLVRQIDVQSLICVVDNASDRDQAQKSAETLAHYDPDGSFISNPHNTGYSAGNNIGARFCVAQGCDAILIINPDIRLTSPTYLRDLFAALNADPGFGVAASALMNLTGRNENPMVEPGFIEELFWPAFLVLAKLGLKPPSQTKRAAQAHKVSGACFMIDAQFLTEIGYFDEAVFLYCEESVLAAQLRQAQRPIAYLPGLSAIHAHVPSTKGDALRRVAQWDKSRAYYLRRYSRYGRAAQGALALSRRVTLGLTWLARCFVRGRNTAQTTQRPLPVSDPRLDPRT